jgi:hypothetical protein
LAELLRFGEPHTDQRAQRSRPFHEPDHGWSAAAARRHKPDAATWDRLWSVWARFMVPIQAQSEGRFPISRSLASRQTGVRRRFQRQSIECGYGFQPPGPFIEIHRAQCSI